MNNYWLDLKKKASLMFGVRPNTAFNIRPIKTTKGRLVEWQLLLDDKSGIDYAALTSANKPMPGCPVLGNNVVRFHADDVTLNN